MLKIRDDVDLKELDNITENDFINYVNKIRNDEITNIAPLGFSGDDFIIFENKNKPLRKEFISEEEYKNLKETGYSGKEGYDKPVCRSSQLSMRKYGDECELLITDYEGNFLTYSKLNFVFSDEYIGKTFYKIFKDLKQYMGVTIKKIDEDINWKEVKFSEGFDILNCYLKYNKSLKDGLVEKIDEYCCKCGKNTFFKNDRTGLGKYECGTYTKLCNLCNDCYSDLLEFLEIGDV
jgi:hypothetical protein